MLPILHRGSGNLSSDNLVVSKSITHDVVVNNTRSQFLKANFVDNKVTVLTHQQSSMLYTFALANCLIYLPEGNYELKIGSKVDIYHIF